MEQVLFHQMVRLEECHWWWLGRRAIVEATIRRLGLPAGIDILEAGCGTGGNLAMLSRFGNVYGMELDDVARNYAVQRKIGNVEAGKLPDPIPFPDRRFDLVVLMDVLEHLEDDCGSLKALRSRLKPGGFIVITVPALKLLWSPHDDSHHHFRRYTRPWLKRVVTEAGFSIQSASYYNSFLFPLVLGTRMLKKVTGNRSDDTGLPMAPVNATLRAIFSSERHVLSWLAFPVGVSLILIAKNPQ